MINNYVYHIKCLSGEYLKAFDKVELYAEVHGITDKVLNDSMMNLLDLFSTAQKEGKPLEKVVGNNIERFCEDYFSDYSVKQRIFNVLKQLYIVFWMGFIFGIADLFAASAEKDFNLFRSTSDMGGYIFGVIGILIIITIVNRIVRSIMFKIKITTRIYAIVYFVIIFVTAFCGFKCFSFLRIKIPTFLILVVSGMYIIIYYLVRMYYRLKRNGTIRKEKEIGGFKESLTEMVKKELPSVYIKKYEKLNRKKKKSGLTELTKEEYMDWIWKEKEKEQKISKIVTAVVVLFIILVIISVVATSSFIDGIIFAIILVLIEIPIIKWILKGGSRNKAMEEMLMECKEKNITIFEYKEMQDNNSL